MKKRIDMVRQKIEKQKNIEIDRIKENSGNMDQLLSSYINAESMMKNCHLDLIMK